MADTIWQITHHAVKRFAERCGADLVLARDYLRDHAHRARKLKDRTRTGQACWYLRGKDGMPDCALVTKPESGAIIVVTVAWWDHEVPPGDVPEGPNADVDEVQEDTVMAVFGVHTESERNDAGKVIIRELQAETKDLSLRLQKSKANSRELFRSRDVLAAACKQLYARADMPAEALAVIKGAMDRAKVAL